MSWSEYSLPNCELSTPLKVATGLIRALKERRSVCGLSAFAEITPLTSYDDYSTLDFAITFESALNATIVKFVNHTINGGDFTRLEEIPMWTVESIYEYLGEKQIDLNSTKLVPRFYAQWAKQKYRVINLLSWIEVDVSTTQNQQKQVISYIGNWEEVVSEYNSLDWSSQIFGLSTTWNYQLYNEQDMYSGTISRVKFYYNNQFNYSVLFDLYLYSSVIIEGYEYYQAITNTFENEIGRVIQDALILSGDEYISSHIEPILPDDPKYTEKGATGVIYVQRYGIAKFNVSGGFEFGDWGT